ncbi:hypothetical protein QE152_g7512 [Popillia japonica]|uniref:Uncharacterized protein n=1 Tax=Popillia japonica TaxID=7064 RepID=A0AAW1MDM7_POPJA
MCEEVLHSTPPDISKIANDVIAVPTNANENISKIANDVIAVPTNANEIAKNQAEIKCSDCNKVIQI